MCDSVGWAGADGGKAGCKAARCRVVAPTRSKLRALLGCWQSARLEVLRARAPPPSSPWQRPSPQGEEGVPEAGVERLAEQHLGPSSWKREPGPRLTGVGQAAQAGLAQTWREEDSGRTRWEIRPECCLID